MDGRDDGPRREWHEWMWTGGGDWLWGLTFLPSWPRCAMPERGRCAYRIAKIVPSCAICAASATIVYSDSDSIEALLRLVTAMFEIATTTSSSTSNAVIFHASHLHARISSFTKTLGAIGY